MTIGNLGKRGIKMKIKSIIFLVIVLFFCYQNCSQKQFADETSQNSQNVVSSQKLSDLQVQNLKFFTEKDSELQKGAHTFYVKTKTLYSLDTESGVLAEHDQAADTLNTYCLTTELLNEIRSILGSSSVCQGGKSTDEACAQVIVEPYAELVTANDVIQLGSASDACGSNKVDLCEDQSSVLKGWIESVRGQLPQLGCGN